jgi:hypothetical protein
MTCPDLLVLSQLLDDEIDAAEAATLGAHVAACTDCGPRFERLERVQRHASAALAGERAQGWRAEPPVATPECLSIEQRIAWFVPGTLDDDRDAADRHLEGCDHCLGEVLAAARMIARLNAGPTLAVPPPLLARVASLWPADATPAVPAGLTEIVVRLGRAGAALVERRIVAPLRDVIEIGAPAPALRTEARGQALRFRIRAPGADIDAAVVPTGESVAVTLVLRAEGGEPLANQRVFVRRHGRSIFSARTDENGELRTTGLEPGAYEVSCPGIQTEFRLDLRD